MRHGCGEVPRQSAHRLLQRRIAGLWYFDLRHYDKRDVFHPDPSLPYRAPKNAEAWASAELPGTGSANAVGRRYGVGAVISENTSESAVVAALMSTSSTFR